MADRDPYDVLGLAKTATLADINAAYRRRAQVLHPDKGGGAEAFAELSGAYSTLSDNAKRENYDRTQDQEAANPSDQITGKAMFILTERMRQLIQAQADLPHLDLRGMLLADFGREMLDLHNVIEDLEERKAAIIDARGRWAGEKRALMANVMDLLVFEVNRQLAVSKLEYDGRKRACEIIGALQWEQAKMPEPMRAIGAEGVFRYSGGFFR